MYPFYESVLVLKNLCKGFYFKQKLQPKWHYHSKVMFFQLNTLLTEPGIILQWFSSCLLLNTFSTCKEDSNLSKQGQGCGRYLMEVEGTLTGNTPTQMSTLCKHLLFPFGAGTDFSRYFGEKDCVGPCAFLGDRNMGASCVTSGMYYSLFAFNLE